MKQPLYIFVYFNGSGEAPLVEVLLIGELKEIFVEVGL
jgi:hypothetical protein